MEIYALIKISDGGGLYHYLTTGKSEVVTLDGNARQFITGLFIDNFELISSAGEIEGNNLTLRISETNNAGYWKTFSSSQNILHKTVALMRKESGVLLESKAIFTGYISGSGSTPSGQFFIKLQDRTHELTAPFSYAINSNDFPNAPAQSLNNVIAFGFNDISETVIPPGSSAYPSGVVTLYLVDTVLNVGTYAGLVTVDDGSAGETFTAIYRADVDVPNYTVNRTTFNLNGQAMVLVTVSIGGSLPNTITGYPRYAYKNLTLLTAMKKTLKAAGISNDLDETSTANVAFEDLMKKRFFQFGSDLVLMASTQIETTALEIVRNFQVCLDCYVRFNVGKIEFVSIPYGNVTSAFKLWPSDCVAPPEHEFIDEEIINDSFAGFKYQNIATRPLDYEIENTIDKRNSLSYYQTHAETINFRYAYTDTYACAMLKYRFLNYAFPTPTMRLTVIESQLFESEKVLGRQILPGDIFDFTDNLDITRGQQKRFYFITRITRNYDQGTVGLVCRDITVHANYDYTNKLRIQSEANGITHFCDHSIEYSLPITNYSVKQFTDATSISGLNWHYNAANACLYIPQAYFDGIGNISTHNQISISIMMNPLSIGTAKYVWCIAREDTQRDLLALRQTATGTLTVTKQTNSSTDWSVTSTNTISTGTWYHVLVYFEKSGSNTIVSIYVNGVRWATGTQTIGTVTNSGCAIGAGIYFGYGGTPVQYSTASFEDFSIFHGNPYAAGGATCTQQSTLTTFFGINGKTLFQKSYPPD